MSKPAPPNYIAGLGRGASGFTTRSDIGPAREGTDDGAALAAAMLAAQGIVQRNEKDEDEEDGDEEYQDPDKETGLFNTAPYEADDEEADRIYEEIDRQMDERHRSRREAKEQERLRLLHKERPKIQEQFADLKRDLSQLTDDDWSCIPEVGDLVRKRGKKPKHVDERFSAVPDSVLPSASNNTITAADDSNTDFAQFGQARDKVLSLKLDQMSDSVSGQTTIDPKGYLTGLTSVTVKSDAEIGDIKKARTLLRSVTTTNPQHGPGWIAAARLEEVAGNLSAARALIAKGCEHCAAAEDVWLEAARLDPTGSKAILAMAVRQLPQSVKIWLKAASLESESISQRRILRRALEFIPNSVLLWKAAVALESDDEDARVLLSKAVQCVPLSVELWLALVRLEPYDKARKALNKARIAVPTSYEVWLSAAQLEEQQGKTESVERVINRAIAELTRVGANLTREQWLQEAQKCETQGFIGTCQAIVRQTIGLGVDDELLEQWLEDAEACLAQKAIATCRAVYAHAVSHFPNQHSVWIRAASLEKSHGTRESLEELLQRSVRYCPQAEVLWLMGAKEKWLSGDIQSAKDILKEAFAANPNSEQIWLAAIKLETETGEYMRARTLLESARRQANTERVWMKSAVLERKLGQFERAIDLVDEALKHFPHFYKLWLIKGQILSDDIHKLDDARETYAKAVKQIPKAVALWIYASRLEEEAGAPIRARALLEKARIMNPKNAELWCEAIRVEARAGNPHMPKALLAKALQECSTSGLLWSEAILLEARPQRKARSTDALKKCENDPYVLVTIARLFWSERKTDKARNWFIRAVKTDSDYGDAWAWWLKFETMHASEEQALEVVKQCVAADPKHGEAWQRESKRMEHVGYKTEQILKLVAASLENNIL